MISCAYINTPLGPLLAAKEKSRLIQLRLPVKGKPAEPPLSWTCRPSRFEHETREISAYFSKKLTLFSIPLAPLGTDFQQSVWRAMLDIPFGATASYKEIAEAIHNPRACRAVGRAAGANPLPIVIPCHRVIGSNGALTGFGSGLAIKQHLLQLEAKSL
ncbi:MAG: methylated-DNA--[protein]-cysteine S-methyltransferase [Desulfobacteraceae bacterium]